MKDWADGMREAAAIVEREAVKCDESGDSFDAGTLRNVALVILDKLEKGLLNAA